MSHSFAPSLTGCAALAALALVGAPAEAQAQEETRPVPVGNFREATSGATRYATPDGQIRFIFERSGRSVALLRLEDDPEVHVLHPQPAAGGGAIYRSEDGSIMLRVTATGGITLYTRALQTGAPASEEGRVGRLTPEAIAVADMQQRFRNLQARARQRIGQTVTFSVPAQLPPEVAGLVVDAAERAAEGLAAAPMTSVRRVIITLGRQPAVALRGDTLFIQVAPQYGYAGRPSSMTIRNIVTGSVQGPEQ